MLKRYRPLLFPLIIIFLALYLVRGLFGGAEQQTKPPSGTEAELELLSREVAGSEQPADCAATAEDPSCIASHDAQFVASGSGQRVTYEQFTQLTGVELVHGDRSSDLISWTFDAGAGDQTFTQIMAVLEKYGIQTTVFVTGDWVEKYPQHFQRLLKDGHEIGNHSYRHPYFTKLNRYQLQSELRDTARVLKNNGGPDTQPLFRYPYGSRDNWTHDFIQREGYKSVFWSLDTVDWQDSPEQVKERVLKKVQGGDIILSHLGDAATGPVLDELISGLQERGYRLVTISKLMLAMQQAKPAVDGAPID